MKLSAALGLALVSGLLVAGSVAVNAQQSGFGQSGTVTLGTQQGDKSQPSASTLFVLTLPALDSCPVGMRANHGNGLQLLKARNKSDGPDMEQPARNQVGQTIHLILTDPAHGQIIGATVRARGLTARARISRTSSTDNDDFNVTRTMSTSFFTEDEKNVSANLWLPGFSTVNSLKLISVTYADGSTRKFDDARACTVTPDPLMLVSAH